MVYALLYRADPIRLVAIYLTITVFPNCAVVLDYLLYNTRTKPLLLLYAITLESTTVYTITSKSALNGQHYYNKEVYGARLLLVTITSKRAKL